MRYANPKMLLAILPMLASLSTFAQIEKGTTFLGGRMNFNRSLSESNLTGGLNKNITKNFSFNPRAGYFISNSFAIGIGLDYNHSNNKMTAEKSNYFDEQKNHLNDFAINVFGRYTKPVGKKFFLFLDGNVSSGFSNSKSSREHIESGVRTYDEYKGNGKFGTYVAAIIRPGIIYFVSPRFGIETSYGSLGYTYSKQKDPAGSSYNKNTNMGLNLSTSSLMLGANYYFKHKPKPLVTPEIDQE